MADSSAPMQCTPAHHATGVLVEHVISQNYGFAATPRQSLGTFVMSFRFVAQVAFGPQLKGLVRNEPRSPGRPKLRSPA